MRPGRFLYAALVAACTIGAVGLPCAGVAQQAPGRGFFVGLEAGIARSGKLDLATTAAPSAVFRDLQGGGEAVRRDALNTLQGVLGGLHVGYRFGRAGWSYAAVASYTAADLEKTVIDDAACPADLCVIDDRFTSRLSSLLMLSGRVGRQRGSNLLYLQAGAVRSKYDLTIDDINVNAFGAVSAGLNTGTASAGRWLNGLHVGIGDEFRLSDLFSVGVSHTHVIFQSATLNAQGAGFCAPNSNSPLCVGKLNQTVAGNYPMRIARPSLDRVQVQLIFF